MKIEDVIKSTAKIQHGLSITQDLTGTQSTFTWKIEDVSELLTNTGPGESIWSEKFFTHDQGYQLQLQLIPVGVQTLLENYMSLYLHICSGPFDDALTWPFRKDVTFQVVDVTGAGHHISHSVKAMVADPATWEKPTSRPTSEVGVAMFLLLRRLKMEKNCFLRDDALFLRIRVSK